MEKQQRLLNLRSFVAALLVLVLHSNAETPKLWSKKYACGGSETSFPFCDKSLPLSQRVKDYVSRLTLQEKIDQLGSTTAGVPRLGVPPVEWWSEALHGISVWGPGVDFGGPVPAATMFPMTNTLAASFNSSLFFQIGQAISTEARAMHNLGRAGLTYWAPNINIFRDPRWGRGQETPGEDPLLAGTFAAEYVKGMQDLTVPGGALKVSACCKHLTGYDIENSTGAIRFDFNAIITEQDLRDTYNAPFQMCVEEGQASCLMCSYTRLNGVPSCADYQLLTTMARKTWNLDGYIVTDRDSIQTYYVYTNYSSSAAEAAADALLAGVDLNAGRFLQNYTMDALLQRKINESIIDRSLEHTLKVLMRLGFFDGDPTTSMYGSLGPDDVCSEDHKKLALEASKQGIVLLKNINEALPLSSEKIRSLAVVGPNANGTLCLLALYQGIPCQLTTVLQGLRKYTDVIYAPGCADVACKNKSLFAEAIHVASKADAVIMVIGIDNTTEGEGQDRTSLFLPGYQQDLVIDVIKAAKRPVVLVVLSGGPMDISFAVNDSRVGGIIWAGYPGQDGGQALAEVIFGEYNPGGRLSTTWYLESYLRINISNMNIRPDPSTNYPGRTYRFFTDPVLFDFGYGLSYTKITENFLQTPDLLTVAASAAVNNLCTNDTEDCFHIDATNAEICNMLKMDVSVEVKSEGSMPSSHALLLYSSPPDAGLSGAPIRQLVAFKRVWIDQNSSIKVEFQMNPCKDLSYAAADGQRILPGGTHMLLVGDDKRWVRIRKEPGLISTS